MRKLLQLLVLGLLVVTPALAQQDYPRAEIFGGYSYLRTDLLLDESIPKGWNAGVAGYLRRNIGIEADVSGHYVHRGGTVTTGFNDRTHLFMFGPKFAARSHKVTPWGHALFGAANVSTEGQNFVAQIRESRTWFAWAVGAGIDAQVHKHLALRVFQADYVRVNGRAGFGANQSGNSPNFSSGPSNNLRLSFGLVWRWGGG